MPRPRTTDTVCCSRPRTTGSPGSSPAATSTPRSSSQQPALQRLGHRVRRPCRRRRNDRQDRPPGQYPHLIGASCRLRNRWIAPCPASRPKTRHTRNTTHRWSHSRTSHRPHFQAASTRDLPPAAEEPIRSTDEAHMEQLGPHVRRAELMWSTMLPRQATLSLLPVTADPERWSRLDPRERSLLGPGCTERRRHEFSAGRGCAQAAMAALGVPAEPVFWNRHGAPIWPAGTVGSISHSRTLAAPQWLPAPLSAPSESISRRTCRCPMT